MKVLENFKSVRFRLFATLCISVFLIIVCLIIVNNVVLEGFYLYSKYTVFAYYEYKKLQYICRKIRVGLQ